MAGSCLCGDKPSDSTKVEDFLTSCLTTNFSRKNLLHMVCYQRRTDVPTFLWMLPPGHRDMPLWVVFVTYIYTKLQLLQIPNTWKLQQTQGLYQVMSTVWLHTFVFYTVEYTT